MFRKRKDDVNKHVNGIGSGGGVVDGDNTSKVLIQRLIIFHDGLMPLKTKTQQHVIKQRRNPQLSENASLEEHGEFILYYYDHSLHFTKDGTRRDKEKTPETDIKVQGNTRRVSDLSSDIEKKPTDYATEEAVRFAGVCRALRSLPQAIQHEMENDINEPTTVEQDVDNNISETDVVHLNDSTLVFIPLELNGDVVAVAQIVRADNSKKQQQHNGFGADSNAITQAIRHMHASFSLLFGGGIHRRLLRTRQAESSKDWVLEVIEDDEQSRSGSSNMARKDSNDKLKRKNDSNWELGVPSPNPEEETINGDTGRTSFSKRGSNGSSTSSRRKQKKRYKKLSGSFSLDSSYKSDERNNISSSFNSGITDDGGAAASIRKMMMVEDDYSGDYRYGGMKELFDLRREHRKLLHECGSSENNNTDMRESFSKKRWASAGSAQDLFNDIANDFGQHDCERRIENLLQLLPITALRKDLVDFMDDRLFRMQKVCETIQGGVGRCLVESIPYPISSSDGNNTTSLSVRGQHTPTAPNGFVILAASEKMKSLINEEVPNLMGKKHDYRLYGMSLFYQNRLALSEVKHTHKMYVQTVFPPELSYTILEYFRQTPKNQDEKDNSTDDESIQQKNSHNTSTPPPLSKWMSGLAISKSEDVSESAGNDKDDNVSTGYLAHPSPSSENSLFIRSLKKHVWMQRIHLPSTLGIDDDETELYAAMYESEELCFILYFEMPSIPGGGEHSTLVTMAEELRPKGRKVKTVSSSTQAFKGMLIMINDELSEFCSTFVSKEGGSMAADMAPVKEINSESIFAGEPGMDIIYIDRDENNFVLLSQHDLSSNEFKRPAPKTDVSTNGSKQNGGGWFGSKPKNSSEEEKSCIPSHYSNMLDCRHKLAAYLPLEVLIAFDDMFNTIGKQRIDASEGEGCTSEYSNHFIDSTTKSSIELCTFLNQGWVYGRAFGNVEELYILLDTAKFVTISDVQKAVTRVRERLFNDKIR